MSSELIYSPYDGLPEERWLEKTQELADQHPLNMDKIVEVVLDVWEGIFQSSLGSKAFKIGRDIFPKPQIMAFFLHALIPLELATLYPDLWRGDTDPEDKDLVYIPDVSLSIEIKTSSSSNNIYGNRSYAQKPISAKKSKSGYYLAINFGKFTSKIVKPDILKVRFGWLDHTDWIGQKAPTGQQARLSAATEGVKLILLYPKSSQSELSLSTSS